MRMASATITDPALERIAWVLVAAILGLLVREIWQWWRARKDARERDRLILTALAREVFIINGIAAAIVHDINRERSLLREAGRWRLKPLMTLPTSIYDLAKDHIPKVLLEQEDAFVELIGLQTQCAFMNQLATEQGRWKSPAARGQPDQQEVIVEFHAPLEEAITGVVNRCSRLLPVLVAAGEKVGGLDLKRIDPAKAASPTA